MQLLYPFIMTGSGSAVVFAVAQHLFDLPCLQVPGNAYRPDHRRAHDALVPERKFQQKGDPLVGPALVFAGDGKHDVFPAAAPVPGKTLGDALRTLGQQEKADIGAHGDNAPGFFPPGIRLLQKEVGSHADPEHFTASDLIPAAPVPGQGIAECGACAVDLGSVPVSLRVKIVHIAVFAALAAFPAAMPWVPDIVQCLFTSLMRTYISPPARTLPGRRAPSRAESPSS